MKASTTLFVATAAMFATSALAAVSNLESYHFRFDFSKGTANFIPSAEIAAVSPNIVTNFVGSNVTPVEGPNGAGNAVHITSSAWQPFESQSILNDDWTLAMTFRPGTEEGGTIISLGRLPKSGSSAVAVCSSEDTGKLYVNVLTRTASGTYAVEKKNELTGLGDVTQGYHTLVVAYKYADSNKGTLYFYWDGVSKGNYTLTTGYPFGSDNSKSGMQFNQLVTRGATAVDGFTHQTVSNNSDYSLYDVRLYPGQFSDADATAYAALYPADRMGSPFRPSAYVESGATNTSANASVGNYIDTGYLAKGATTRFAADFQFLDVRGQQRIFGARGTFVQGLYVRGSDASGGNLAWNFMGTDKWVNSGKVADRLRRIATFDRVGKTVAVTNYDDRAQFYYNNDQSDFLKDTDDANTNTYLFAENSDGAKNFGKARIYSFEADEDGTPVLFLAPDMENGEAGFRNIIDGTFHGDGNKDNNPERTLRFYNGVGCASDYKYEDSTLYAKLYATSDGNGTVSVAEGEAAASAEGWVPHGGTLALSATASDSSQYQFNEWTGDTWAIADGFSKTNASIEVSTPYAVQLRATFRPTVDAQLTIAADGADAVNWSIADWRSADDPSVAISAPVGKEVTVIAHKSVTLTLDADVSLSKFTVQADTNCVVTFALGTGGAFYASEVVVSNGVLRQGSATAFGATPLVTVENGGTFDLNGLAPDRGTAFVIAGAGAGDWPWALTTSVATTSGKTVDILELSDDATVGCNVDNMWLGVRSGATFNPATQTLPLTLNGHTLTKTGTGTLQYRRPYSTNEGTIDVQEGTLRVSGWSNAVAETGYGETCVSNITLVVREGATTVNAGYENLIYPVYFKTINCDGGMLTTSSKNALGVYEVLSGHGTTAALTMADGVVATLDGNLDVTTALTVEGALSFVRKAGVETNVTVAATGTLTASNAITIGAGVVFDIGANRPAGTLTVDDDATLVLRQANLDEDEIVVKASSQPQNITLYDTRGLLLQNPEVSYDADAGTVTVRAPTPVWTNADGTGSFNAAANWSSGAVPGEGRSFKMSLDGDTTVRVDSNFDFGTVQVEGTGSVSFEGEGALTFAKVLLTNGVSFAACGRVTAAQLDVPTGSAATLTTFVGVAAGGVTGVGTLVLVPGEAEAVTISGLSSFTGDFTVTPVHSMTGTLTCAATSLKKFTLNGTTNVVFTLVKGKGGSFKASEAVVAGGVLQQGGDNVLGETPKITVQDGGTFDINAKTIRQETPIYIAGAGAGNWPWALASSAGAMASGNYLFDLYLTADATIGAGQFKIGRDDDESYIYLNGHTLKATSWLTLRNVNTKNGTIDLRNSATLNLWNNLNSQTKNRGTTLIVRQGYYVQNNTDRKISVSKLIMYGGSIRDDGKEAQTFGIISELRGHGTITKLVMESGAKFYPDGADYLNVTKTLSGKLKVDISDPALTGKAKIPLLKVPVALKDTADGAFDLTALPPGWQLQSKDDGTNVEYLIRNLGFSIFIR